MAEYENGKCPMLKTDVIRKYGLSDDFVKRFCGKGCSVECGKFLKELLEKKGPKPVCSEFCGDQKRPLTGQEV